MVECVRPEPSKTIGDPATDRRFFLGAYDFLVANYDLDRDKTVSQIQNVL